MTVVTKSPEALKEQNLKSSIMLVDVLKKELFKHNNITQEEGDLLEMFNELLKKKLTADKTAKESEAMEQGHLKDNSGS